MIEWLRGKGENFWYKNRDELYETAMGRIGSRHLSVRNNRWGGLTVPTFVFHRLDPERFESQLHYLRQNRYVSLDADQLVNIMAGRKRCGQRTVALTFDDGMGSFWSIAYPLLKKYAFKAILFVIAGLVPQDEKRYWTLEDVAHGSCGLKDVTSREDRQPLCTWHELQQLHQSGLVDIQSHSMTHARVHVSSRIVDFIHPGYDAGTYGNTNVPVMANDNVYHPLRKPELGVPVYRYASRVSGRRRYLESSRLSKALAKHVKQNGGRSFFYNPGWRRQLMEKYRLLTDQYALRGRMETDIERRLALLYEFDTSRRLLEERLQKKVRHFCYPWFEGSDISDKIATGCGYRTFFYGLRVSENKLFANIHPCRPSRIARISEEYLFCLPGKGQKTPQQVFLDKLPGLKERLRHQTCASKT